MAVAALPAAVWWALGSAAAGGAAAKATGHDWKKGAALGGLGGLGLSTLLAPAAATAGAGAGVGSGVSAAGTVLSPAAAEASVAGAATAAEAAGAGAAKAGASTLFADMLKGGAASAVSNGVAQTMQPETEMITPGQPLQMAPNDPNSVFQLIQQLKHRPGGIS